MAKARFGIGDIMNMKSRTEAVARTEEYREIYLDPREVKPSDNNFYSQENIEELADSFLAVGQQQPAVLGRVNGEFRIVSGHRRNLANILNIERGHEEYKRVRFLYRDMTEAVFDLSLLIGNAYNRELSPWERTEQAGRLKKALIRAKEEDGLEIPGKLRDVIAELLNESSTNIARKENLQNHATPEIKEEFAKGNLGISAAYEAAKLPPEEQKEIADEVAAGSNVRAKEIAKKVAEKRAGDDYETPHPESITSLCYSCQRYQECNVKTGTCKKCDQYINKAEAEKTEEQRYEEEQERIDRETRRRLREQEDLKKMDKLSGKEGKGTKIHEIKIAAMHYEDVVSRRKRFTLRKNDRGYRVGDWLKAMEYEKGSFTGRVIEAEITYMLEDYTGLEEGFCILGFEITGCREEGCPNRTPGD